ncbi:hypothetical protein [Xylophilus sp. GOD-11R]|uniref:hypothetical protein n=1 Tax=Xylophilus sp. GOD-11R TaxID=3089814 RepID=UPI00298CF2C3|nr:hypothetical protein [Xylophilus sp. GOD-11R]WPB58647.1 hypothetical protein R9X41_08425 [Xylophilus sp. GOD-11R]
MHFPYPATLPLLQSASKSRSQPTAFSIAEPRRGYGYAQATGTDTPVFWDGEFKFTTDQAIAFQLWFTQTLRRGLLEFTMPIRTEFGLLEHLCRFLADDLGNASENGGIWTYPVKLMTRRQLIPAAFIEAQDLITGLPSWRLWSEMLDRTVNAAIPES